MEISIFIMLELFLNLELLFQNQSHLILIGYWCAKSVKFPGSDDKQDTYNNAQLGGVKFSAVTWRDAGIHKGEEKQPILRPHPSLTMKTQKSFCVSQTKADMASSHHGQFLEKWSHPLMVDSKTM